MSNKVSSLRTEADWQRERAKCAVASMVGIAIEWYDFFLYGTAAAIVFNKLFFPEFDPLVGTILAFASFAIGFIARPLGGIFFGHYGDRIGRKLVYVVTLLVMGIGTAIVGLLPSYAQVGIWAPILLVTLRVIQGFGLGGAWGGAVLMVVEHAPQNRRGFYGSLAQLGAPLGLVLGTVFFGVFAQLPQDQFLAWGWRVPFLLSILLVIIGLWIRRAVTEFAGFRTNERIWRTGWDSGDRSDHQTPEEHPAFDGCSVCGKWTILYICCICTCIRDTDIAPT